MLSDGRDRIYSVLIKIHDDILIGKVDAGWLEKVEEIDNIFPNINYRTYRTI